jgi:hypothetical protein
MIATQGEQECRRYRGIVRMRDERQSVFNAETQRALRKIEAKKRGSRSRTPPLLRKDGAPTTKNSSPKSFKSTNLIGSFQDDVKMPSGKIVMRCGCNAV